MQNVNLSSPIVWDAPLNRGLLRWWLCLPNVLRGNTWRELTRKSDATISGASVAGARGRQGGWGCYEFDGTNDSGQTGAIDLSGVSQLTIAMWLYIIAYATNDLLIESSPDANSNTGALQINLDNTGAWTQRIKTATGNNTSNLSPRPSAGAWFHYILCANRSVGAQQFVAAYVNGVSQTLTSVATDTSSSGGFGNYQWNFCSRNAASLFANLRLDDFRMYNRVLRDSEALELYRTSKAGYPHELRWLRGMRASEQAAGAGSGLLRRLQTEGLFVGSAC